MDATKTTPKPATASDADGPSSALNDQMAAALESRRARSILRRLPSSVPPTIDFTSNDYLSLSLSPLLRRRVLDALQAAPQVLGSGGSRLLVNPAPHAALERRLARFFSAPGQGYPERDRKAALLFNSGFDANVALLATLPQPSDALVLDAHVHASVHDGARASRVSQDYRRFFAHNDFRALRSLLRRLTQEQPDFRQGSRSVFVAVESVYSMDGTVCPLREMLQTLVEEFPAGNGYLVVDEAHATGIYGPHGRGLIAELGLEHHPRLIAQLHTFGKALAGTGAVVLTTPLARDYLVNYARPLIYTTALSYMSAIAIGCSFDLLEDGTASQLAETLRELCYHFLRILRPSLRDIPPDILALPSHLSSDSEIVTLAPIVPLMTAHPRALSSYLETYCQISARPITWPTVPRGTDRVRVCLRAGHSRADVERLVAGSVRWAHDFARRNRVVPERGQAGIGNGGTVLEQAKL